MGPKIEIRFKQWGDSVLRPVFILSLSFSRCVNIISLSLGLLVSTWWRYSLWVPWKADSETEISACLIYYGVCLGETLMEGRGRKQDLRAETGL